MNGAWGARSFGTLITWFLLGGDLYTAYTFIAVPALMFGAGATGFFAVPYAALMYPMVFIAFPRLWSVAHRHGYITAADFVKGRFGHRWLALAIAVTGLVAVMPYIALQLVGMQVVIAALGLDWPMHLPILGTVSAPLVAAFVVLAAFTYTSGLRGTALIAVAKDLLVYITVLAAIIIIPAELGGYGKVFASVPPAQLLLPPTPDHSLGAGFGYITLALGSLLALFLYPHSVTGILSSSSRHVIRRNAILLPAYSVALALIALLGYMAVASGVNRMPEYALGFKSFGNNFAGAGPVPAHVPALVRRPGVCGYRHRRNDAGLDHGNRLRQPLHPQHLQGVHRPGLPAPDRGAHGQDRGLRGQAGGAVLCAGTADRLCHPASVAGRHLDLPDGALGAAGAVCAARPPARCWRDGPQASGWAPGWWRSLVSRHPSIRCTSRAGRFPATRRSAPCWSTWR